MTLEAYLFLAHSDTTLLALMSFMALYRYTKSTNEIKLIGLIALLGCMANLAALFFASLKLTYFINIPGSIYDLVQLLLLSVLYNNQTQKRYKLFFTIVPLVYTLLGLLNLTFFQKEEILSYTKLVGSLIVLTYAVIYFYRLMIDLPTNEVHRLPMFWFNSSFLIFSAGTVFLFAFTSYLIHVLKDNLLIYYSFHNVLSIISHIIVVIGLLFHLRSEKSMITT